MKKLPCYSSDKHFYLFLFLLVVLLGTASLKKEFLSRGEAREALVSQQMLEQGNFVLPLVYSGEIPSKPPLSHWLALVAAEIQGGVSEFTSRFPSFLTAILFLVYFYSFLKERVSEFESLLAALMLALSFEWLRAGMTCRVDLLFSALLAGSLLESFRYFEAKRRHVPFVVSILLAGAVLTKGPVGLAIYLLVIASFLISLRLPLSESFSFIASASLPAAALALLWYFSAYTQEPLLFGEKVWAENAQRLAGTMDGRPHHHGIFRLYGGFFLGLLPWSFIFLPLLPRLREECVDFWRTEWGRFVVLSIFWVLILFALPASKRPIYLLPAYPFFFAFLAKLVSRAAVAEAQRVLLLLKVFAVVFLAGLLFAFFFAFSFGRFEFNFLPSQTKRRQFEWAAEFFNSYFLSLESFDFLFIILVAATLILLLCLRSLSKSSAVIALFSFYCSCFVFCGSVVPSASKALSAKAPAKDLVAFLHRGSDLYSYGDDFFGLSFYSSRPITRLEELESSGGGPEKKRYIVLYDKKFESFQETYRGKKIEIVDTYERAVRKPKYRLMLVTATL